MRSFEKVLKTPRQSPEFSWQSYATVGASSATVCLFLLCFLPCRKSAKEGRRRKAWMGEKLNRKSEFPGHIWQKTLLPNPINVNATNARHNSTPANNKKWKLEKSGRVCRTSRATKASKTKRGKKKLLERLQKRKRSKHREGKKWEEK